MKRLLLTGVAGFAGSHALQHFLVNSDWEIIGIDSLEHKGLYERIEVMLGTNQSFHDRFTFIKHDLVNDFTIAELETIGAIDYIVNFASESHVDRSITHPVPFVRNNVELMLTMLEFARWAKPAVFIQISTDEVYGAAPVSINHREWASSLPSNPYSASKAAQEALAISYWRTYNVPIILTNCMNMFGTLQDIEKYIPMLIRKIHLGEKIQVHGNRSAIGSRFYLHARNHADALLFILDNLRPMKYRDNEGIVKPSRYNIVGDVEVNNLELALLIGQIMDKKVDYEFVDFHKTRPGHDRRYALDGQKLKSLGWTAPVDFMKSMEDTVRFSLTEENKHWLGLEDVKIGESHV